MPRRPPVPAMLLAGAIAALGGLAAGAASGRWPTADAALPAVPGEARAPVDPATARPPAPDRGPDAGADAGAASLPRAGDCAPTLHPDPAAAAPCDDPPAWPRPAADAPLARVHGRLVAAGSGAIDAGTIAFLHPGTGAVVRLAAVDAAFAVRDLPAGPFAIWASAEGHAWAHAASAQLAAGRDHDLGEIVLPARAAIVFAVEDDHGAPIANAAIEVSRGERFVLATGRTDAGGSAVLDRVPDGAEFGVTAPGRWPHRGRVAAANGVQRCRLVGAPVLRGRVFDRGGAPVEGARVLLLEPVAGRRTAPPLPPPDAPRTTTCAAGAFALPFPNDAARDLVVTAPGHATAVLARLRPAAAQAPLIVSLDHGAEVAGDAARLDGTPLAGACVEVWTPCEPDAARAPDLELGPRTVRRGQLLAAARTDAAGRFRLADLPAGAAVVALHPRDGAAAITVVLQPGVAAKVALRAPPPAAVRGRVADAPPGTHVVLYGGAAATRTQPVGGDGTFRFDDVPPGRYLLGAAREPLAAHLHALVQQFVVEGRSTLATAIDVGGGDDHRAILAPPAPPFGRAAGVAMRGELPAAGHRVELEPVGIGGAARRQATVAADGTFRVDDVAAGDYDAILRRPGAAEALATLRCRIVPGGETALTLRSP